MASDPPMVDNLSFVRQPTNLDFDNLGLGLARATSSLGSNNGRSSSSRSAGQRQFSRGNRPNSVVTTEGVTITVVKGNICQQMVKGMVNSCGGEFDLSKGVIARAILQQAGQEIQHELNKAKPSNIHFADVVVTKGYRLNANFVFHGCLPNWDKGQGTSEKTVRTFIRNILVEAAKRNVVSLAFPAIGAGALGYPADLVAACLFDEIDKFSSSNKNPIVTEVLLVIYDTDVQTYAAFERKLCQLVSSAQSQSTAGPSNDCDSDSSGNAYSDDDDDDKHTTPHELINNLQLRVVSPNRQKKIQSLGLSFPSSWGDADHYDPYRRIALGSSDPEYKSVEQNVRKTCQASLSQIIKIERIENHSLYQLFMVTRDNMQTRCGTSCQVERLLWHGTAVDALNNIYAGGFNRSYCGKNATFYGNGVYFARDFSYSAQRTYSPPDANGNRFIFQCRVLTGQFALGQSGMIEPPIKSGHVRYDSVVNDVNDPAIFVIFKDTHAYPEYLITFR